MPLNTVKGDMASGTGMARRHLTIPVQWREDAEIAKGNSFFGENIVEWISPSSQHRENNRKINIAGSVNNNLLQRECDIWFSQCSRGVSSLLFSFVSTRSFNNRVLKGTIQTTRFNLPALHNNVFHYPLVFSTKMVNN